MNLSNISGFNKGAVEVILPDINGIAEGVMKEMNNPPPCGELYDALVSGTFYRVHDYFINKVRSVGDFLEKESQFLDFNESGSAQGFISAQSACFLGYDMELNNTQLNILECRILFFKRMREELSERGVVIPDNPDMDQAIELVKIGRAKKIGISPEKAIGNDCGYTRVPGNS